MPSKSGQIENEFLRQAWEEALRRFPDFARNSTELFDRLCARLRDPSKTPLSPLPAVSDLPLSQWVDLLNAWKQAFFRQLNAAPKRRSDTVSPDLLLSWMARFDSLAEAILRARENQQNQPDALFKTAVHFSGIGHFTLDENWAITYWNRNMETLYDIPAAEVLHQPFLQVFDVFTTREKEFVEAMERAQRENRSVVLTHFRHRSKKKGLRTINIKIIPVSEKGNPPRGLHILVRDMTDHLLQQQRLDEYQRYIENILHDAADAIIVLDAEDRIRLWNRGAEALYGWRADEIIGQPITVIVPDDPASIRQIEWINRQVREEGYVRNFQAQRRARDGRLVLISITRTAIRNEHGEYIGSSVIARNITEEKRMEQQLIQSEKLSAVGKLAAGIAHEVATPLTSISSLAQYLRELTSDPSYKEKLTTIQNEIERIARTVRELVDFSRPIDQEISTLRINHVVQEAVRIVRFDRRIKRKTLQVHLADELPEIRAGFDQLLQVFINLLLNAADALENKKDGKIIISTAQDSGHVLIRVRDNGEGIPEENLSRIFEPFFTTKKKGKGTGLGLWVSYNIIKSYAGEIHVESTPGQGSTFSIRLPVQPKQEKTPKVTDE